MHTANGSYGSIGFGRLCVCGGGGGGGVRTSGTRHARRPVARRRAVEPGRLGRPPDDHRRQHGDGVRRVGALRVRLGGAPRHDPLGGLQLEPRGPACDRRRRPLRADVHHADHHGHVGRRRRLLPLYRRAGECARLRAAHGHR